MSDRTPLTESELAIMSECLRTELGGSKEYCRAIAQRVFTSDPATLSESDLWAFKVMSANLKKLQAFIDKGKIG